MLPQHVEPVGAQRKPFGHIRHCSLGLQILETWQHLEPAGAQTIDPPHIIGTSGEAQPAAPSFFGAVSALGVVASDCCGSALEAVTITARAKIRQMRTIDMAASSNDCFVLYLPVKVN